MNNKILARVVALVLAVMMLGTVSFAAAKESIESTDGTFATATDQRTVLAFATNTEGVAQYNASTDKIIAVVQQNTDVTTIPIDSSLLNGYEYITVYSGGSNTNGSAVEAKSFQVNATDELAAIELQSVAKTVELNGTTYTNVAYLRYNFKNAVANGETVRLGIKFNIYKDGEEVDAGKAIELESATAVTGAGADLYFGAAVFAVDYEKIEAAGNIVMAQPYTVAVD